MPMINNLLLPVFNSHCATQTCYRSVNLISYSTDDMIKHLMLMLNLSINSSLFKVNMYHMYQHTHTYIHTHVHTHTHTHMCTHTHTHTCTCAHTHTHTYIHICVQAHIHRLNPISPSPYSPPFKPADQKAPSSTHLLIHSAKAFCSPALTVWVVPSDEAYDVPPIVATPCLVVTAFLNV